MNEQIDDLDCSTFLRRARRWTIGLVLLLSVNFSLVAIALGYGATRPSAGPLAAATPIAPATELAPPPQISVPPAPSVPQPPQQPQPIDPLPPPATDSPQSPVPPAPPVPTDLPPVAIAQTPEPTPPAPAQPAAEPPPENVVPDPAADSLIIINPHTTGGPVHFAIEGVVYRLDPGQYRELQGSRERKVEYHQGDDFGYAAHRLMRGTHAFDIQDSGWKLLPIETATQARKLLEACTRTP
jgi:hypothetical protein